AAGTRWPGRGPARRAPGSRRSRRTARPGRGAGRRRRPPGPPRRPPCGLARPPTGRSATPRRPWPPPAGCGPGPGAGVAAPPRPPPAASPARDLVDQAVLERLGGREPGVALGVAVDAARRLAGGGGQELVDAGPLAQDLLGGPLQVGGLALELAGPRLVDQDPGVGGGPPPALGPRGQ